MAKFYAQSGSVRTIVHAEDAQGAALWLVHQSMQCVVPALDHQGQDLPMSNAAPTTILNGQLRLSERGFDRADAEVFEVYSLVAQWAQLMSALAKIDQMVQPSRQPLPADAANCTTAI